MAITLRTTKGSALTYAELDANFTTLSPTTSMSTAGYWKDNLNGLIIQWGNVYVGNNGSDYFGTWTFPLAFPTGAYQVYVTLYNTTGNSFDASSAITSWTTTSAGFTVQEWSSQYQAITARFIAIGR